MKPETGSIQKAENTSDGPADTMSGLVQQTQESPSKRCEYLPEANEYYRKNTIAKKLFMGSSSNTEDPVVDDSNDRIYSDNDNRVYALTRSGGCKSTFIVKMVNHFGQAGGFERILERIRDAENWAPIEVVSIMVTLMGNISSVLHRDFAVEFIPRLEEVVWRNLLKSPDSNIRNFTKERIDNILQAFDLLLKRVYSLPEKNEVVLLFICMGLTW